MTKDFIKNLIAGLTGRVIRVCLSLSVILLLFFALMFGFTLNSSINQKFKDTNERITALIAQQQSTPVGLVSVYTLDGNDRVVEYKGQQTPSAFPAHSNENVTLHVQDFLITFRSTLNSAGREVRIYQVRHGLEASYPYLFEFTASNIFICFDSVTNGIMYSIKTDITIYAVFALIILFFPMIIGFVIKKNAVKLLTQRATREIIPAPAEIQDKAADVSEGQFDAYLTVNTDVVILKKMVESFNQMFSAISSEINMYKQAAIDAKADSENRGHFLANMSHEIRTPLNAIYNLSRLIDNNTSREELYKNLVDIQGSSKYLLTIINDFLDLSKAGAEELKLDNTIFDIVEVFQSCQFMMQAKADEKGVALMCHVEPEPGKVFVGDATKLKQVFINLLSNSVKFTHKGEVTLTGKVHKRSASSVTMRFTVKDTGIGMTSAQMDSLFNPYQQADVHTQRRYGGTGLGMTISRKIVELMGGVLEAESLEGVGTKFSFNIEFATQPAAQETSTPNVRVVQREAPPWYGLKALVFEDNKTNQRIFDKHLKAVGIEPIMAEDGAPGIKIYNERRKEIDVIFMDMNMIEMDGAEATQRLRELGAQQPIILCTAMTVNNFNAVYKPQGFTDTLDKSFERDTLWQLLDKYFQEKPKTVKDNITLAGDEDLMADALSDLKDSEKNLKKAYKEQNWQQCYKICHSVKGVTAVINAVSVNAAAKDLEVKFKEGADVSESAVSAFCAELNKLVQKLSPSKPKIGIESKELLEKVHKLLELDNADAFSYIKLLKKIPGTDVLIGHLENYDILSALTEMEFVLQKLGV